MLTKGYLHVDNDTHPHKNIGCAPFSDKPKWGYILYAVIGDGSWVYHTIITFQCIQPRMGSWHTTKYYVYKVRLPRQLSWFATPLGFMAVVTRNTAFIWPWCFCDQRGVMDDVWCGRANRILVDVISKAKNPWFWCIKSKSSVSPRRNYHFWCFSELPN